MGVWGVGVKGNKGGGRKGWKQEFDFRRAVKKSEAVINEALKSNKAAEAISPKRLETAQKVFVKAMPTDLKVAGSLNITHMGKITIDDKDTEINVGN